MRNRWFHVARNLSSLQRTKPSLTIARLLEPPVWLLVSDGLLVLGNSERLPPELGVLGEFSVIWLNELATLLLVGSVNLGRSVGGRGAGPGFMN